MKKPHVKTISQSAPEQNYSNLNQYDLFAELLPPACFNPANRAHREAAEALLKGSLLRAELGEISCRLNAPQLMADMGLRNLHWECPRESRRNLVGEVTRQGRYHLTPLGREVLNQGLVEYYSRPHKHG